jgi:hypothetical protein
MGMSDRALSILKEGNIGCLLLKVWEVSLSSWEILLKGVGGVVFAGRGILGI